MSSEMLLSLAAREGSNGAVSSLLLTGVSGNTCDLQGESPLYSAASREHEAIVSTLLQAGVQVDAVNRDGETALFRHLNWALRLYPS